MNNMQTVDLDQLRALIAAGSVQSVTFEAVGKDFALKVAMPKSEAVLVPANSRHKPRLFADLRRAFLVLSDLGIRQALVDVSGWEPKQRELGEQRVEAAKAKKAPAAKKPARKTTKKA